MGDLLLHVSGQALATLVVLAALAALLLGHERGRFAAWLVQSAAVVALLALAASFEGSNWLGGAAAATALLKLLVAARLLPLLRLRRSLENQRTGTASRLIGVVAVLLLLEGVPRAGEAGPRPLLEAAVASLLAGLVVTALHDGAMTRLLGLLLVENGALLLAALAADRPMALGLMAAFDLLLLRLLLALDAALRPTAASGHSGPAPLGGGA